MNIFWDYKVNGQILNYGEYIMLSTLLWYLPSQHASLPDDIFIVSCVTSLSKQMCAFTTFRSCKEQR